MKRVLDNLAGVFERNRLVFWYDPSGEWAEHFDAFNSTAVQKLKVNGDEFGTKVRIVRDPNPAAKFLLYFSAARPPDADNWLLDLLLQGREYNPNSAALVLDDAGLSHEFMFLAQDHAAFFKSTKRVQAFKALHEGADTASIIQLKLIAVLANSEADIDTLLLRFLAQAKPAEQSDPVNECLAAANLTQPFWGAVANAFGYTPVEPSFRDWVVALFRAANPLDSQVQLHPHAQVFLQRWKDSQANSQSFSDWSQQMEQDLNIATTLDTLADRDILGDNDTFALFENFSVRRLCHLFAQNTPAQALRAAIQKRRNSFWKAKHEHGYIAIEQAVELRELLAAADLTIDSLAAGLQRYTATWWRIDRAYRRCTYSLRQYAQPVMEALEEWAEREYVNNFLLPLADMWGDQVKKLDMWACPGTDDQRSFSQILETYRNRNQKVFVIISDALRYEAAADFSERLNSENKWTAEIQVLFASLPTYTQLGMASLLPGTHWDLDATTAQLTVDGNSATGTANRSAIIATHYSGKGTAMQAEVFLALGRDEGRTMASQNQCVYIFHNVIDKTGDTVGTEGRTFDAVAQAFDDLEKIVKKVASFNGVNMLLTADHGFLFQQQAVAADDLTALPAADEWTHKQRRFAIGRGILPTPTTKVFSAAALGLGGDWSAAFPLALGRFPLQGSGKRYVHGGISLQEVVVPLLRIHKARTDDTQRVELELLAATDKITTAQCSVRILQKTTAAGKTLPRTVQVGLFALDNTPLSDTKMLTCDSSDPEPRNRESIVILTLSRHAAAFNNKQVEIRVEEQLPGTNQNVVYLKYRTTLVRPLGGDFDAI